MDTSDPAEAHAPAAEASKPVTAAEALKMLEEGNARWVAGASEDPNTGTARRGELAANGQHPFVTVLTCADSRLPVERLFDRGVGDVFVARVAGAVAADGETGTIEYGVGHLHTPLLVVMGHTKCGAVAAAVAGVEVHGKVAGLIDAIEPAVARAKRNNAGVEGDALAAVAVKENVWQSMFDLLKHSPEIRGLVQKGELTVVGAVCDISTGKVEFMGEHPWQSELMAAMDGKGLHAEPGDTKAVTGVTDAAGH
ncbi:MAG: carbonic anhydrase [Phycisphaerales bacterium]|nr:carbonic anhydrase [Phycisphaerales bacterium]